MATVWGYARILRKGDDFYAGGKKIMRVEPDPVYPSMWRVVRNDGTHSDAMNRTWANHTARTWSLAILNTQERARGDGPDA